MGLNKYKLGELIERSEEKNTDGKYSLASVKGVSIQKVFIETKANMEGVSLLPYLLVKPDYFVYVPVTSRNGNKITLAHNDSKDTYIVSSSYEVFHVSKPEILNSKYLFIVFNRPEFDRYARFNSWGSARESFSWEDFCDIELDLPPIEIQQKYVDIYDAMLENQQCYEEGLEDLKLVCDAYIEQLRREMEPEKIGAYLYPSDKRNSDLKITLAQGITNDKYFASPKRVAQAVKNTKIVKEGQFAYKTVTTNNGGKLSIAYREGPDCIVSSSYQVFGIIDETKLLPQYLMIWFKRSEFDRYVRYKSHGSAHEFFNWDEMCNVEFPIPDIEIQQSIVNIYRIYNERKQIAEEMKTLLKEVCPLLVKGAIEEAEAE